MTVTTSIEATPAEKTTIRLLWLDLTRKCQLKCSHCYKASGPDGAHGTMTREDWISVLDQAAAYGVRNIQPDASWLRSMAEAARSWASHRGVAA